MNQIVRIDERAFKEGVKEVLRLRPLMRVVKAAVSDLKDDRKPQRDKVRPVVKR